MTFVMTLLELCQPAPSDHDHDRADRLLELRICAPIYGGARGRGFNKILVY